MRFPRSDTACMEPQPTTHSTRGASSSGDQAAGLPPQPVPDQLRERLASARIEQAGRHQEHSTHQNRTLQHRIGWRQEQWAAHQESSTESTASADSTVPENTCWACGGEDSRELLCLGVGLFCSVDCRDTWHDAHCGIVDHGARGALRPTSDQQEEANSLSRQGFHFSVEPSAGDNERRHPRWRQGPQTEPQVQGNHEAWWTPEYHNSRSQDPAGYCSSISCPCCRTSRRLISNVCGICETSLQQRIRWRQEQWDRDAESSQATWRVVS